VVSKPGGRSRSVFPDLYHRTMAVQRVPGPPSEAETVYWLKRALEADGLGGRRARHVLVDRDPAYVNSPFARRLEPMGSPRIGNWRPDVVCTVEHAGSEYLAGFEVKGVSGFERGVVQASRYRDGVHEAYLCVPRNGPLPDWLVTTARQTGVGLLQANPRALILDVSPEPPRPEPSLYLAARRYLLGEETTRSLGLNRPLHYAAALIASTSTSSPIETLVQRWGLGESAARMALRGAETLGLLHDGIPTARGLAWADVLQVVGFDMRETRFLTGARYRLVRDAPGLAAVLRAILLTQDMVRLVIEALQGSPTGLSADDLAWSAHRADEALARALFGPPPERALEAWDLKPWSRFQLKAALYDIGALDSPLGPGASGGRQAGYDARLDRWQLGTAMMLPNSHHA
jgi:hypothetical protein